MYFIATFYKTIYHIHYTHRSIKRNTINKTKFVNKKKLNDYKNGPNHAIRKISHIEMPFNSFDLKRNHVIYGDNKETQMALTTLFLPTLQ